MSSKRKQDPSNIEPWLVSVLEFDGDWAMLRVPDLVRRGMIEGFRLSDLKDILLRCLREHSGHVAPVLTSIRIIELFHEPKRCYLWTRTEAYASLLRVYRGLLDRLRTKAASQDARSRPRGQLW